MQMSSTLEIIDRDRRSLLRYAGMGIAVAGVGSLFPSRPGHAEKNAEIRPFRIDTSEEAIFAGASTRRDGLTARRFPISPRVSSWQSSSNSCAIGGRSTTGGRSRQR
jgi:hypothetical protein